MAETTYIVLRRGAERSGDADWSWTIENSNVQAASAEAAIRLACKNDSNPVGTVGTYVAVPARSWKPVTVQAVQTTVLKLETAADPQPG